MSLASLLQIAPALETFLCSVLNETAEQILIESFDRTYHGCISMTKLHSIVFPLVTRHLSNNDSIIWQEVLKYL